ncbi:MAG: hypothetical protein GWO24_23945, partial [Akkermansiaceae bacterium]|nr:hypothetical protein [Akkermansiaceae bacterium]
MQMPTSRSLGALAALGIASLFFSLDQSHAQLFPANSETQFSGVQGQDNWSYGYRNVSQDGGGVDYDPVSDFVP